MRECIPEKLRESLSAVPRYFCVNKCTETVLSIDFKPPDNNLRTILSLLPSRSDFWRAFGAQASYTIRLGEDQLNSVRSLLTLTREWTTPRGSLSSVVLSREAGGTVPLLYTPEEWQQQVNATLAEIRAAYGPGGPPAPICDETGTGGAGKPLSEMDFDELVRFLFDRPEEDRQWFINEEWEVGDPEVVARHLVRLLHDPGFLADRHSARQIGNGLTCLESSLGVAHSCRLLHDVDSAQVWHVIARAEPELPLLDMQPRPAAHWLARLVADWAGVPLEAQEPEPSASLATRISYYEAMPDLFEKLVAPLDLEEHVAIWWEEVVSTFERPEVTKAQFRAMCRCLEMDHLACQRPALVGLVHMVHPEAHAAIHRFLDEHPGKVGNLEKYLNRMAPRK